MRSRQPSAPHAPLVGRDAERQEILAAPGPVVVCGPAGMGKTALARSIAPAAWIRCFPGESAASVEERARSAGAARWVVDDVHRLGDDAARLVERLGRVVATSERRFPAERIVELGPLSPGEVRALWNRWEEQHGPTPRGAWDAAFERVRGVPLALRREFAAARLGRRRPWDISALPPAERVLLEAAAVLFGSAAPRALGGLAGLRRAGVDAALAALARRQLVDLLPDGTCEIHDVVRAGVLAEMAAGARCALHRRAAARGGVLAAARHLLAAGEHEAAAARLRAAVEQLIRDGSCAQALCLAERLRADLTDLRARLLLSLGRVTGAAALAPRDPVLRVEIALAAADVPAAGAAIARARPAAVRGLRQRVRAVRTARAGPSDERLAGDGELVAAIAEKRARGAELEALHAERERIQALILRGRTGTAAPLAQALAAEAERRELPALARDARLLGAAADADDLRVAEVDLVARPLLPDPAAARLVARAAAWVASPAPDLGDGLDDVVAKSEIAWARGDATEALDRLTRAVPLAERSGRRATLARVLADAARLHLALGQRTEAEGAAARSLAEASEGGIDRAVGRALLVQAALWRESGLLLRARATALDAFGVARAAALPLERYLSARVSEVLARAAGDAEGSEALHNVARAAAATLGENARAAAERMLGELRLGGGYRMVTGDGIETFPAALAPPEPRELVIDGIDDRVLRRGTRIADLRRRTILKRLLFLFARVPGRVVAKQDIVARLWNATYHPLRHDASLFTNVMRVRRLLGDDGAAILQGAEGGYRLVPPGDYLFVEKL